MLARIGGAVMWIIIAAVSVLALSLLILGGQMWIEHWRHVREREVVDRLLRWSRDHANPPTDTDIGE